MKHARIGVIGDVHAEDDHLQTVLDFLHREGVDRIVCTGDIADGTGDINRCCDLLQDADVLAVRGNHDRWLLTNRVRHIDDATPQSALTAASHAYLHSLPVSVTLFSTFGPVLLCHGMLDADLRKIWPGTQRMPPERCERLDGLVRAGDYRLVINGHMHYRCLVHFEQLTLMNAGTLKARHRPGFSIIDCDVGTVTAYEFAAGAAHPVCERSLEPSEEDRVWRDTQHFDGQWQPNVLYATDPAG